MYTVTGRIKSIKQPKGGYLNPKDFEIIHLGGDTIDIQKKNVSPALVGTTVDYMTRFMTGSLACQAFEISGIGASNVGKERLYKVLLNQVKGLDDMSIKAAVRITGFDCAYRVGPQVYKPVEKINPDWDTIENIRRMVLRSMLFFDAYGPKILDTLTFEGGYTDIVVAGDGDFMTEDTLWDFKVSKQGLNKDQTLQLLMYWRMGLHSIYPEYQNIKFLGIYNPRLDVIYRIGASKIPKEIIKEVEEKVIGY